MRDLRTLSRLILSPTTGILRRLLVLPAAAGSIPLVHLTGTVADYGRLPCGGSIARPGGSSFTMEDAWHKVIFEAVERYCAAFVDRVDLVLARPTSTIFLAGDRLPLYAPFQYEQPTWPLRRLTEDSLIHWVRGESLFTGRRVMVPAALVYLPYEPASPDEWLGPSTSTGMAAHWDWAQACLTGLLEVCERDAFAIMWMNRLSMPRLIVDLDDVLGPHVAESLRRRHARVTFVDISTDLAVPVVVAVLDDRLEGRRLVTVGASASWSPRLACRKAFAEAVSEYERLREKLAEPGPRWTPAPDFSNVTDFEWHGLLYADPAFQDALDFMTASPVVRRLDEMRDVAADEASHEDATARLVRRLRQLERHVSDVVVVDLTTHEFAELGLHVVKIVVPDAVPLNADHRLLWLGHDRLYAVPERLGYRTGRPSPADFNPMPHPFA